MNTVYYLRGIPASGKSTWAKQEVMKRKGQVKRFNKDSFRDMLDNGEFNLANEKYINAMRNYMVESALRRGFDVIIDDTNFNDSNWEAICDIAKRVGNVQIIEKTFDVTLKEALIRNRNREFPVPDDVVKNMYDKHVKNKPHKDRHVYFEYPVPVKMIPGLRDIVIVDLDGTLAINNGQRSFYDYEASINDDYNEHVVEVVKSLHNDGIGVVIMTGRDGGEHDKYIMIYGLWLEALGIDPLMTLARKLNDRRPDYIIKKELYDENILGKYNVIGVIDDRKSVTDMWRTLGLTVFQVNTGDF